MSGKDGHIIPPEELMAFLDGQLNLARRKAVEEHLKTCPECRSLLESLELAEQEVARVEMVEAPEGYFATFASRVANRIARKELAPKGRPWLLRWGWMPAAAAAAFAAVIVLSHGFYEQPQVYQAVLKRRAIPIPIAPEPRVPETVAVLETYYEEAPSTPAAEGASSEKDRLAASGAAQPAPAAASKTDEIMADEVSSVARTRAASTPGLVDMTGAPAAPPDAPRPSSVQAPTPEAKGRMAASGERKSAAAPALEIADKTQQPEPAPQPGDRDETKAKKEDERLAEADREGEAVTGLLPPRRRLVRLRQIGASRVLLPAEPVPGACPVPDVAEIEAIVIHLPNGGGVPPPELGPALRICVPQ